MADFTDADLRGIFAEELERQGAVVLAAHVRSGDDNSQGGVAALAALKRVNDHYDEALRMQ
jgi:hypothetical protein